ncbi:MAG: TonB-dependent receptor plug domain-containing protein [Mucilaginibacter sp.]
MKFTSYLLALWLVACFSLTALAQSDSTFLNHAQNSLSGYFKTRPVEKVYLHLDRSAYNPGDTIWFKAYTVVGESHQLSALSGVLYCELINEKDSVITRHTLKLIAGLAWADFALSRALRPGNYHIRAYTNWMRNAGPAYFFNQSIQIVGAQTSLTNISQSKKTNPDIQFFPEGGELINGVRSRVAVKSMNANGFGLDIKGVITDNEGNEVAAFETQHLGMGVFALMPQAGKTYKANITNADSIKFSVDLPQAHNEGFTLGINNSASDSIYVKLATNDQMFRSKQNSVFYLVAQSGGKIYFTAEGKLTGPVFTTRIPKNRFPSGIVQFTLFSQTGEPLNERIVYVQNNDTLKLTLSSPSTRYLTRQKVKIAINAKGPDSKAATSSFSVSVINESRVPLKENSESTILNTLLLTSDIKGFIEEPNYYFTNVNDKTRADLDILMLTQGYRRFEWKKVLNDTTSQITYQPQSSLALVGGIKTPAGKPLPKSRVTMVASTKLFADTVTDIEGNFNFKNLDLPDTAKVVLRARKANNGSNVTIYVKQPDYPPVTAGNEIKRNTNEKNLTTAQAAELSKSYSEYQMRLKEDSLKKTRQLKEVVIKDKAQPKPDVYNNYGTALEYNVDMKRLAKEFFVITEAITYSIPGVSYRNGIYYYENAKVGHFIVDGFERTADALNYYLPKEIESIRMISATGLDSPKLILTTKRYAGTDTSATIKLKEVSIKSTKVSKKPELVHSDNLNGAGNADQVFMGDRLSGCVTISDCLNGKLFGVTFGSDGTPSSIRTQGRLTGALPMVIIVDGIILQGAHLNDLNANDIYSIEVLRSGSYLAVYGSNAPGGALVITTRRGGDNPGNDKYLTSESPTGLITVPFKGYYKVKTFYAPRYAHPKKESEPLDLRNTIYWNPNIITDKNGNASIEYFNADTKGTYRVVIEGIDDNGNLGRQVYRYKVE